VVDQAVADAESLERARFGPLRIDTDGHTPAEAAELIAATTGWPR
jgi:hypothetical protein